MVLVLQCDATQRGIHALSPNGGVERPSVARPIGVRPLIRWPHHLLVMKLRLFIFCVDNILPVTEEGLVVQINQSDVQWEDLVGILCYVCNTGECQPFGCYDEAFLI